MSAVGSFAPQGIMRLHSLLFVLGDRPARFHKAIASRADAPVLDLEDAIAAERNPAGREAIATYLPP